MHELEFQHLHVEGNDDNTPNEAAWSADHVVLMTVGIDIGSSTSHLMFARVHLQRLSTALSSRFVVVERQILAQSPILLTPYVSDYTINVEELGEFIGNAYEEAGLKSSDIDSGAVILTGEAIKRRNARAIADLFSEEAGKFVCASAGHHLECELSAHGSGAVAISQTRGVTVLNVDIGGGTTKFALIENGQILATAAIAVGGRLIVEDSKLGLSRIEGPAHEVAQSLGVTLALGQPLSTEDRKNIVSCMGRLLIDMIERREPSELARRLLVTDAWPASITGKKIDAMTFSGGVAEFLYKRETKAFGDIGADLANRLRHMLAHRIDLPPVWDVGHGIRATVIGAAQFSVQLSGSTISIAKPELLPLQNLPVVACNFNLADTVARESIASIVRDAIGRSDLAEGEGTIALAFPWRGTPTHARMKAVAGGICAALPRTIARGEPFVLLIDGDIAMSLGRIIRTEVAPTAQVIALDGVQLKQFDYVDIGRKVEVTNVVPVIIKSLLFSDGRRPTESEATKSPEGALG